MHYAITRNFNDWMAVTTAATARLCAYDLLHIRHMCKRSHYRYILSYASLHQMQTLI